MVMASLKVETIHTWVFAFDSAQTCNIVNNLVLSYRSKKKKKKSTRNNAASTAREMKLV